MTNGPLTTRLVNSGMLILSMSEASRRAGRKTHSRIDFMFF
jgi:hypothetical protein